MSNCGPPPDAHSVISLTIHLYCGWSRRAASIIEAELSTPVITACGHLSARTCVLLPGPHPRSTTARTSGNEMRAARSRHGCVRSSPNFMYWSAFQVGISSPHYDYRLSWTLHYSTPATSAIQPVIVVGFFLVGFDGALDVNSFQRSHWEQDMLKVWIRTSSGRRRKKEKAEKTY